MLNSVMFKRFRLMNKFVPMIRTSLELRKLMLEEKMLLKPLLYGFSLGDKIRGMYSQTPKHNLRVYMDAINLTNPTNRGIYCLQVQ